MLRIVEVDPSIRKNVEANDGYCPCAIWQTPDTKCMCKEFREQKEPGLCHCGRFEKREQPMERRKRMIDANKLWLALDEAGLFDNGNPRHIAQQTVEEQPTVDAVEVVHGH